MSIQSGLFPNASKQTVVIPLYKVKGEKVYIGNYRPISLVPVVLKVFEK